MVYEMKLKDDPFKKVLSGKKSVELRLFDEKRRSLDIGDVIIFTNLSRSEERLAVRITALYRYACFEDLFSEILPERCGYFDGLTIEEASSGMKKYYTEDQIRQYGVLGIKIEMISLDDALRWQAEIREAGFDRLFPDGMK